MLLLKVTGSRVRRLVNLWFSQRREFLRGHMSLYIMIINMRWRDLIKLKMNKNITWLEESLFLGLKVTCIINRVKNVYNYIKLTKNS